MHCDVTLIRARLAISYIVGEHANSPLVLEGSPSHTLHLGITHAEIKHVCLVPLAYSERCGKFFDDIGRSRKIGLDVMKACHMTVNRVAHVTFKWKNEMGYYSMSLGTGGGE